MTTATKRFLYWRVNEGSGHILDFADVAKGGESGPDAQASKIWLVGTYGCRTCVGLYVRISPTRCLMLHINATPTKPIVKGAPQNREGDKGLGAKVQDEVLTELEDLAKSVNWEPTGEEPVEVCCPLQEAEEAWMTGNPQFYTGHYIMNAIRTFLKRKVLHPQDCEGFIVDQRTGTKRVTAPFDAQRFKQDTVADILVPMPPPPTFDDYVGAETSDDHKWEFFVKPLGQGLS